MPKKRSRKRQPNVAIPPDQAAAPAYPVSNPNSAGRKKAPRVRPRKRR